MRARRRTARYLSVPTIALAATILCLTSAACGGDGYSSSSPASAVPGTRAGLIASEIIPDLKALGFNFTVPEKIPAQNLDIAFSLYERKTPSPVQARVEARVYPTEEIARGDFKPQADGWKNPPPQLFGGDPKNTDLTALARLPEARAYIATNRDPGGNRVWTDVYRIGRVIVVAHVVAANEAEVGPVRQAIADAIRAKLK